MAEYLIQEESLIEICDLLREKFTDLDGTIDLIVNRRTSFTSIVIPNGTTTLCKQALGFCIYLTDVTIPSSVNIIESGAFWNCSKLTNLYLYNELPPTIASSGFNAFDEAFTIHVPIGSEDTYTSATNWSQYADRIVGDIVLESEE